MTKNPISGGRSLLNRCTVNIPWNRRRETSGATPSLETRDTKSNGERGCRLNKRRASIKVWIIDEIVDEGISLVVFSCLEARSDMGQCLQPVGRYFQRQVERENTINFLGARFIQPRRRIWMVTRSIQIEMSDRLIPLIRGAASDNGGDEHK